ncbi:uncharacterized protein LOC132724382 [Ruditapes philippinarum]|uniref:uncharacterized protein LOC132724382 n=1 Tax=Ruditapes philippinarum TaxID=129788 RepID=UPI00295BA1EB|nr:uncharacterized protein LOC132724382 [Ruditapes philippinarum]
MKQFTHIVGALIVLTFLYGGCYGYINVQGDIMVAGLFGVFERSGQTCSTDVDIDSVMTVEAVKWYIEKLNEVGNLPINIGLESFETCQVDDIAAEKAVEILNRDSSNGTVIGRRLTKYMSTICEIISLITVHVNHVSLNNYLPHQHLARTNYIYAVE